MISDDRPRQSYYQRLMATGVPHIRLRLGTDEPMELLAFVGAFTALAAEYGQYLARHRPDLDPNAQLYVKEIRAGSVEAVLIPVVAGALPLIENANALADFVRNYGSALSLYLTPQQRVESATDRQLSHFVDQVAAIAESSAGTLDVAAIDIQNGAERTRAFFGFNREQTRAIRSHVQDHRLALATTEQAQHMRVLMTFTRTDVQDQKIGARSGEKVLIESLSPRSLHVIYASVLAEERIRFEIREDADNVYKKGFVVDVNVELRRGRPIAYRIIHVHEVLDLADED